MKENDVRNMDLTSRKAGEGSGEDERLLMMLGEALGDMPGDEETQKAWRLTFEAASHIHFSSGSCCRSGFGRGVCVE